MAKGFKFPAPKGYAKGGMCKPKGAKGYAKGGPARGTNMEASDMYDPSDLRTLEAGQNVPRENKNRMRSESVQNAKAKADLKKNYDDMYSFNPKRMMGSDVGGAYTRMRATEDQTGEYKKGGKVKRMSEGGLTIGQGRALDAAIKEEKRIKKDKQINDSLTSSQLAKGGKVKRMAEGGKMRSESTQYAKAADRSERSRQYEDAPVNETEQDFRQRMARNIAKLRDIMPSAEDRSRVEKETGYSDRDFGIDRLSRSPYASGGKVTMAKTKMGRKFAKVKTAYADGGEVETEQSMSKATKVKMPKGAAPKGRMPRAKAVPVAGRAPVIAPPQAAPMAGGMAPSPLARVARAPAPMPAAGRMGMGMKMGGKAKKR